MGFVAEDEPTRSVGGRFLRSVWPPGNPHGDETSGALGAMAAGACAVGCSALTPTSVRSRGRGLVLGISLRYVSRVSGPLPHEACQTGAFA